MFVDLSLSRFDLNIHFVEVPLTAWWRLKTYLDFFFPAKKQPLKTFNDIKSLIQQGKKREVKLLIRENAWPVNATIRAQLWPALCAQHHVGKGMLDGFYWDMVNQVRNLLYWVDDMETYAFILQRFSEQQNFLKSRSCCRRLLTQLTVCHTTWRRKGVPSPTV